MQCAKSLKNNKKIVIMHKNSDKCNEKITKSAENIPDYRYFAVRVMAFHFGLIGVQ